MRHHVLIIDDDDAIVASATYFFESDSCKIAIARDREAAIEHLDRRRFDVVILDIALTGGRIARGLDLLSDVRRFQPSSRVIVASAFGSPAIIEETISRGADSFLHKPISITAVGAEVRRLLEPKRI